MRRVGTYVITYDEVTPESAEDGDFSDHGYVVGGWDVSTRDAPVGADFKAWCTEQWVEDYHIEADEEEGESDAEAIVATMRGKGFDRYSEPNMWGGNGTQPASAYTKDEGCIDYSTGTTRRETFHIDGVSDDILREVYTMMRER